MPMPSIFISYAHSTAAADARALKAELGELAFLDESGIATREDFTRKIANALMESKVAVIFADKRHDDRPFCRWERNMILAPTTHDHVFLMLPVGQSFHLDPYPHDLRNRNWNAKAADIRQAIENRKPLRELIGPDWRFLLAEQMEITDVPAPKTAHLASIPHYGFAAGGSLNQRFVGRADLLAELDRHLRGHHGATVALTTALTAAGGFGKTRMALEYVHRYAPEHFTGGVFWVRCEDQLETQFWEILNVLNRTPGRAINQVDFASIPGFLADRVRQQVAESKPVLFVLDNVPETPPGQSQLALDRFCPPLGTVSVIVTSRQQDQAADHTLEVGALDEMAASLLLTNQLPTRTSLSYPEWDEITKWVGRLPIALEMLNKALRSNAIRMPDLLARARSKETAKELDVFAEALGLPRGATQTFEISYEALTPPAQFAARCLAQLGPEPIPEALFTSFGSPVDAPSIRAELHRHSWVTMEPDSDGVAYFGSMHRVLASYLRSKCATSEETEAALGAAVQFFDREQDWRNPKDWPLLTSMRPHALVLMAFTPTAVIKLGVWLGLLSSAQGDLPGALKIRKRHLEVCLAILGEEHPGTFRSMINLARTLLALGDSSGARAMSERALQISIRMFGETHRATLAAMNNLGETMRTQGDLRNARAVLERVVKVAPGVVGTDSPTTLNALNNLALTMKAQGDLSGARGMHEQELEICRRVLGEEHPDTLTSANNLASVMFAQRDFDGARRLNERTLEIRRCVLGPEHHSTYASAWNLLTTLEQLADRGAAAKVYRQHLRPMLNRDQASLPADLRSLLPIIRHRLAVYGD